MVEVQENFSKDGPVTNFGLVIVLGLPGQPTTLLWDHVVYLLCLLADLALRSSWMC